VALQVSKVLLDACPSTLPDSQDATEHERVRNWRTHVATALRLLDRLWRLEEHRTAVTSATIGWLNALAHAAVITMQSTPDRMRLPPRWAVAGRSNSRANGLWRLAVAIGVSQKRSARARRSAGPSDLRSSHPRGPRRWRGERWRISCSRSWTPRCTKRRAMSGRPTRRSCWSDLRAVVRMAA